MLGEGGDNDGGHIRQNLHGTRLFLVLKEMKQKMKMNEQGSAIHGSRRSR